MHELLIERSAEKGLKKLSESIAKRIIQKINTLRENPLPAGSRKIVGSDSDYRIRLGDYRVVYELDKINKRITVMAVGHRKEIYRSI